MTKIFCAVFSFLLLCGCTVKEQAIKPVTRALSFEARIDYYNENYNCKTVIKKNGDTEITFLSPKELKGLKLCYSADKITAHYNGLNYDINTSLPQYSAGDIIHKAFSQNYDTVFEKENSYYVENKSLNCKIYIGATGLPIKIEENSKLFTVTIKNPTIN